MDDNTLSPGEQEEQDYRFHGANDDQITQWKTEQIAEFKKHGASDQQVNEYFGVKEPDTSDMKAYVQKNLGAFKQSRTDESGKTLPHEASTFGEALEAAWQGSIAGTFSREKAPDILTPEHSGFLMRMAAKVPEMFLDSPFMLGGMAAGGVLGGTAGAALAGAAGTTVAPGLGTVAGIAAGAAGGSVAGAGFGAFAVPTAIRQMLIDHYEKKDGVKDPEDFMAHLGSIAWQATKDGLPGAVMAATGGLATPIMGAGAAVGASFLSMTAAQAAIAGRLPTQNEFIDGAVMMAGFHGLSVLPEKLRAIYANTGERPAEVAKAVSEDPVKAQELLSENKDLPVQAKLRLVTDENAAEILKENQAKGTAPPEEPPKEGGGSGEEPPDDVEASRQKVLSRLGASAEPTPKGFIEELKDRWSSFYDSAVNSVAGLGAAEKAVGAKVDALSSPFQRALNYTGWRGKLERSLRFNTVDFKTGEVTGEGLEPILGDEKLKGEKNQQDFLAYVLSKRGLEREETGKDTGIDPEHAERVVEADKDRFQPLLDRLEGFSNRMLKYAYDADMISKDSYDNISKGSKSYIPLLRVQDVDEFLGTPLKGSSSELYPEMKGSERKILDPIESIMRNTARIIEASERNSVGLSFAQMIENSDKGEDFAAKVEKPMGASNEFTFRRNGEEETWKTEQRYSDAINSLNHDAGLTNAFMKLVTKPAALLRAGTVLSPDFIMRHFIRQVTTGEIYSKSVNIPLVDSLKFVMHSFVGAYDAAFETKAYQEFLSSGGTAGQLGAVSKYLENQDVWNPTGEVGRWRDSNWNVIKTGKEALEFLAHISDVAPRVAEFKLTGGAKEGASPLERAQAGSNAREVTLDYDRHGAQTKVLRAVTPFVNIGIQGADRLLRSLVDNPGKTAINAFAAITVPTIVNWAINRNDSRYQAAAEWEKDLYWLFPVNKWEKAQNIQDAMSRPEDLRKQLADGSWLVNNGTTFKISKPFEPGLVYGSLFERMLNHFADHDPHQMDDFVSTILHGITPNVIPTAVVPFAEQAVNKNFFTGRPVIPDHLRQLAPELQYTEYTSTTAKKIGALIGYVPGLRSLGPKDAKLASPMVIDNWIRDYSGTMGQYMLHTVDKGLNMADLDGLPGKKPDWELADVPVIHAFISRNPSYGLQPIQDFYEKYEKATVILNTQSKLMKRGDIAGAQAYMAGQTGDSYKLDGIKKALGTMAESIRGIYVEPKMNGTEKRQQIDTLYYQMWNMAKQGNQILDEQKRRVNANK